MIYIIHDDHFSQGTINQCIIYIGHEYSWHYDLYLLSATVCRDVTSIMYE